MTPLAILSVLVPVLLVLFKILVVDHRSYGLERQDRSPKDGRYTREEYVDMMHILTEINLADPNGHNATLVAFDELKSPPKSILEVGFGLGHFSIMLARKYPSSVVTGIDAHQLSVDAANEYLQSLENPPANVHFEGRRESQLNEAPKSVDIITSTLANHHIFPDEQFVDFIKRVAVIGRQAFIFSDSHRDFKCYVTNELLFNSMIHLGYDTMLWIAKLNLMPASHAAAFRRYQGILSTNRVGMSLALDGGLLSMRRSFSIPEYYRLFAEAGYPAGALKCTRLDKWYETVEANCRVVCVADLTWSA